MAHNISDDMVRDSAVPREFIAQYSDGKDVYAIELSDVHILLRPLKIDNMQADKPWGAVASQCVPGKCMHNPDVPVCDLSCCALKRPPQSCM